MTIFLLMSFVVQWRKSFHDTKKWWHFLATHLVFWFSRSQFKLTFKIPRNRSPSCNSWTTRWWCSRWSSEWSRRCRSRTQWPRPQARLPRKVRTFPCNSWNKESACPRTSDIWLCPWRRPALEKVFPKIWSFGTFASAGCQFRVELSSGDCELHFLRSKIRFRCRLRRKFAATFLKTSCRSWWRWGWSRPCFRCRRFGFRRSKRSWGTPARTWTARDRSVRRKNSRDLWKQFWKTKYYYLPIFIMR